MNRELNRHKSNEIKPSSTKIQETSNQSRIGAAFAGVDSKTYARSRALSEEQIWQKVLKGEIQGRTHQGKLYILDHTVELENPLGFSPENNMQHALTEQDMASGILDLERQSSKGTLFDLNESESNALRHNELMLPPIPIDSPDHDHYMEVVERKVSVKSTPMTDRGLEAIESRLLLDHMQAMQEEQQKLVALTKAAIEQITEQANRIAQAKDEIIELKNSELTRLEKDRAQLSFQLNRARQEIEDLTMLNDALSPKPASAHEHSPII